ncbi:tetratricopeptide repeat protein, partial [bacterium]|nr:tetratricopeptide repeat protein [bacterium]
GRVPFDGPTSTDVLAAILEKQPPALRSIGDFPDELQWSITKALAKDEDERYQNVKDFLTDLKRIRKQLEIEEELKRSKTSTSARTAAEARNKKWIAITFIILLTIVFLSIYFMQQREKAPSGPATNLMTHGMRPTIAVIGFKNLSGSNETTWISSALSEMLSTELAIGEKLLVLSGEEVLRSKKELSLEQTDSFSSETLFRIRKNLPADYLILGSYYVPPGQQQIRLDLNVQKTDDGKIAARFTETRNEFDLLGLVLAAGLHLRQSLGIVPLSQQQLNSVRTSLSSNPEAVRFYSEGLAQLREMDRRGARDLMMKAVKADPKFPLAFSALSQAWYELGYTKNALEAAKTALDLSDGLSREERLLVEARHAQANGKWEAAIRSYQSLFTFFPDNLEYGLLLVDVQTDAGFISDANETIKLLRKLPSPVNEDPRIDLADLQIYENFDPERYLKLAETAVDKARLRGAALLEARALLDKGSALMIMNREKEAITAYETARQIYKSHGRKGDLLVVENRLSRALSDSGDFNSALKSEQEQLEKYRQLDEKYNVAMTYSSIGQIQTFLGKSDDALKSYASAQKILEEIENRNNLGYMFGAIARLYSRTGELAKSEKYYLKAIDFLKDSPDDFQRILTGLASTKKRMGDKAKAREYYEQALTINRNLKSKTGTASSLVDIAML